MNRVVVPSLSLPQVSVSVAAFGDWNSDKNTDLFLVTGSDLNVALWDKSKSDFAVLVNVPHGLSDITNVVPGDFDRDGKLDVLVMGFNDTKNLAMVVVFADSTKLSLPPAAASSGQPFLVDWDGTIESQLVGYPASAPSDLSLWRISSNRTAVVEKVSLRDKSTGKTICQFSEPHSNAFLDLDGDCLADIFVTCTDGKRTYFQVWVNSRNDGFSLAFEKDLPDTHGPISFADMDADGTMDIVFASCSDSGNCQVNIWYNSQMPLCSSSLTSGGDKCRSINNLCAADPNFNFNDYMTQYPLKDLLANANESIDVNLMPLRLGDYDKDGYADILMLTHDNVASYNRIIHSIPCTKGLCPKDQVLEHDRYYKQLTTGLEELDKSEGTKIGSAFFDLYDDGILDILVFSQTEGKIKQISAFQNNIYSEGLFLKSLVLNGVCPGRCTSGPRFPNPKPYGVNYLGATIKYSVTDSAGRKRATQYSQLPQSSYFALNTPYILAGLGRTNNYIEALFVGATKQHADNVATFFGVIPNSQLIIIPYEPTSSGPSEWSLDLFVSPSSLAPSVFVSLLSTLIALSGVVAVLHFLERKEDQIEKRINIHNINFDAL